jgi:hypothetical protein
MWCGLTSARVIRPFFAHEKTVTGALYLNMLEDYAVPQVPDRYVFQQDGTLPHFWMPVTEFLNEKSTGI